MMSILVNMTATVLADILTNILIIYDHYQWSMEFETESASVTIMLMMLDVKEEIM